MIWSVEQLFEELLNNRLLTWAKPKSKNNKKNVVPTSAFVMKHM